MARRKFKFAISMQRFSKSNKEEQGNAEFLLQAYPDLQIAYLDEEPGQKGKDPKLFSALIDGIRRSPRSLVNGSTSAMSGCLERPRAFMNTCGGAVSPKHRRSDSSHFTMLIRVLTASTSYPLIGVKSSWLRVGLRGFSFRSCR